MTKQGRDKTVFVINTGITLTKAKNRFEKDKLSGNQRKNARGALRFLLIVCHASPEEKDSRNQVHDSNEDVDARANED